MTKNVKIKTRNVGQCFACCAVITDLRGKKLYETRDYPYGMKSNAYARAEQEAQANGWIVCDAEVES